MRADRLLDLVALLRRHERITAAELARQLEVSRRTVLRDLDALSLSGVPVYAEHGRGGGFSILPGYRPEQAGLTPDETTALFLPGGEQAARALGRGQAFRSARRKLESVLTDDAARNIDQLSQRLLVVPEGWADPEEPPPYVPELAAAAARHEVVDIGYRAVGQQTGGRRVRPIGLVLAGRTWYLMAERDDSGEQRTYRIDRIASLATTGRQFEPHIELAEAWQRARNSYRREDGVRIRLTTTEEYLPVVTYVVSLIGRVLGAVPSGEGLVEVTAVAKKLARAAALIGGLGTLAEVLSPPELVEGIVEIAKANLERYGHSAELYRLPESLPYPAHGGKNHITLTDR